MIPLKDENPTRRRPYVTYALIAVNVIVFVSQLGYSPQQLQRVFLEQALVPALVTRSPFSVETFLDFIRSMFFHGGWMHLLGNMLYLWIFGDNIEDRMGRALYLLVYFVSGFVAGLAQILIAPESPIPLVGASGAIAGVLGSYALMFPGVKVRGIILLGYFGRIAEIPALYVLGFWFVIQLFDGLLSLGAATATGGVAFFAHIGGFIAGLVMTWLFLQISPTPIDERQAWLYRRSGRYSND